MRLNDGITFGVEGHGADWRPVASTAGPASRIERASAGVQLVPSGQDRAIFTGVALSRADVSNAAVSMVMVVPTHEAGRPGASLLEVREALPPRQNGCRPFRSCI
jgi:hypothetical protein